MIDLRRYCLECSKASGLLVERVCKANEKKAEASRKRSASKAKTKRAQKARVRDAAKARQKDREVICGVDVAREVDRVWAHALNLQGRNMWRTRIPKLTVSRGTSNGTSGRAWSRGRIHLTVGQGVTRTRLVGVIAHEIAHHMSWEEHHSERFWSCLAELVESAYGTTPARVLDGTHYDKQRSIEDGIRAGCAWVTQPGEYKPPRKPRTQYGNVGKARVESVMA